MTTAKLRTVEIVQDFEIRHAGRVMLRVAADGTVDFNCIYGPQTKIKVISITLCLLALYNEALILPQGLVTEMTNLLEQHYDMIEEAKKELEAPVTPF